MSVERLGASVLLLGVSDELPVKIHLLGNGSEYQLHFY
jgi:hypothetical protein